MVSVAAILSIDGVVAAGVVRTLYPDLSQVAVPALSLRLRVCDDHIDTGQELAGLHEGEGVWTASLHQRDSVVSQSSQINKHSGGVGGGGSLQTQYLLIIDEIFRRNI